MWERYLPQYIQTVVRHTANSGRRLLSCYFVKEREGQAKDLRQDGLVGEARF